MKTIICYNVNHGQTFHQIGKPSIAEKPDSHVDSIGKTRPRVECFLENPKFYSGFKRPDGSVRTL